MELKKNPVEEHVLRKVFASAHPFLFTLDSLLFFYMQAISEVPPRELIRPLVVLWALLVALYPLARKITDSSEWGSILLTIFVFGFFFEERYFVAVGILVSAIVLVVLISVLLLKRRLQIFYFSVCLTMLGLVLLIIHSTVVLNSLNSIPDSYYEAMAARAKTASIPLGEPVSGIKPDIYYIVVDAYSGADVLKEFYGYDNSEFIDFLKSRGFIVPKAILSNYPRTALSISSTLDMQYWDSISPNMEDVVYWWPVKPVLEHSRVRESLESIGYQSISIAGDWEISNNTTTDRYFKPFPAVLTEYEDLIVSTTALKILHNPFQAFAPIRTNEVHRRFFSYSVETLKKIPEIPGPKFIFVHIVPPHPPFVFDADGNPINSEVPFTFGGPIGISREEYRRGYLDQIEYVNTQLRLVIEAILDKSTTPPIILLQADHGLGLSVDFYSAENTCLRDRFSAFGAYHLPGMDQDMIPPDLTPVNLFRIIFNRYFDADLELLDNHQYFTKGHNLFAGLQEVTEQVKDKCVVPPIEH